MNTSNHLPGHSSPRREHSSADDLNHLLQEVGTSNPQDLLGAGAKTSLGVAMIQATVATVLLMAVLTVGPYLWSKSEGSVAPKPATPAPAVPEAAQVTPAPQPATPEPS